MQWPSELPVMTLRDAILLPQAMMPLYLFEPRYRRMIKDVLATDRMFVVARQKPGRIREAPSAIAGLGLVRAAVTKSDGTTNLILQGLLRVELVGQVRARPYRLARLRVLEAPPRECGHLGALTAKVIELAGRRLDQGLQLPAQVMSELAGAGGDSTDTKSVVELSARAIRHSFEHLAQRGEAGQLADLVTCALLPVAADRQSILEAVDLETRLQRVIRFLRAEILRRNKTSEA
jgi:Lon protease-like protein